MSIRFLKIIVVILLVFFVAGCSISPISPSLKVENGLLDLEAWDAEQKDLIQLNGEWEFYWDRLLYFNELQNAKPDLLGTVPSAWNKYMINNENLPGQGYATYKLHVKTDLPEDSLLGLRIYPLSSAYRIYINEKQIAANGRVGTSAQEETGEYKPQVAVFSIPAQEFDIIIHISNFQYARGGFWYTMHMGSVEQILSFHDVIMAKETSLLGLLIILALFFLTVFLLRRELKYSLYFALLCLALAISLDMVGQFVFLKFLPNISLSIVISLWFSSTTWVTCLIILYVHELFKSQFSIICMRIYLGYSVVAQIIYLFLPATIYTKYAHVSNYIDVVGAICMVTIVAIGIKKNIKGGWLNIASMVIVLITYTHDNLYWTNVITSSHGELTYYGLFLCLFIQMVIQAKRIRLFYDRQTAAELSFLQAQIKPHFLYNSINTFVSISRYDMDRARELLINFGNYLRNSFDFKELRQVVPIRNELELAKAYVEIEKARFEERLQVVFNECEDMEIKVPILTLQPIIENAINHGVLPKPDGGNVWISIKVEGNRLVFSVKDDGVGMEKVRIDSILSNRTKRGVGLSNIDSRLRKLYKSGLHINSSPDEGTEVLWYIPINRKEGKTHD